MIFTFFCDCFFVLGRIYWRKKEFRMKKEILQIRHLGYTMATPMNPIQNLIVVIFQVYILTIANLTE